MKRSGISPDIPENAEIKMKKRTVLVAGGAGYIGSHTCVELLDQGHEVVCADNFVNSSPSVLGRVERITGRTIHMETVDFCSKEQVRSLFQRYEIDAAVHFAGHKAVGESLEKPLKYYDNNIQTLVNLCHELNRTGARNVIFSSSAVVYDDQAKPPYNEDSKLGTNNPYGRTKLFIEAILRDLHQADNSWNISVLRYFNPVGAHPSGLIGEDPEGVPNNLMPYVSQVAVGRRSELKIFGKDYDTSDGTCIRDFIHVVDLAKAHTAALSSLEKGKGFTIHNVGTGKGYSVLELVDAFIKVNGVNVPYSFAPRRGGDIPISYAAVEKAWRDFAWSAELDLETMVRDTWNWQVNNPKGMRRESQG